MTKKFQKTDSNGKERGFTLIEVMVSVSIFAMVMLIATGAVFSIVEANKKTHTLKSVMTNLNFALESMMRDIRVGFRYACFPISGGASDCPNTPGTTLRFKANRDIDGGGYSEADNNDMIEFSVVSDGGIGRIQKRIPSIAASYFITSPEIDIESMKFYVIGTGNTDGLQPKAVIIIQGHGGTGDARSDFNIQTTVSQRSIDG